MEGGGYRVAMTVEMEAVVGKVWLTSDWSGSRKVSDRDDGEVVEAVGVEGDEVDAVLDDDTDDEVASDREYSVSIAGNEAYGGGEAEEAAEVESEDEEAAGSVSSAESGGSPRVCCGLLARSLLPLLLVRMELVGHEDGEVEAEEGHEQQVVHVTNAAQQTEQYRVGGLHDETEYEEGKESERVWRCTSTASTSQVTHAQVTATGGRACLKRTDRHTCHYRVLTSSTSSRQRE